VTTFDLRCLLCARIAGAVQADGRGLAGPFLLQQGSSATVVQIADWRPLRCRTCGGNVYPDDARTVWMYPPVRWGDEQPRRGRPPNWLVAARKAEAAALGE
jgi:hypothetical protein